MSTYSARKALRMVEAALNAIIQEPTSSPSDDELFDAFTALLNEGNEDMAVMVYAGVFPVPEC
jgi:hypothetical protein